MYIYELLNSHTNIKYISMLRRAVLHIVEYQ